MNSEDPLEYAPTPLEFHSLSPRVAFSKYSALVTGETTMSNLANFYVLF
jgi:hypothetical protein